MQYRILGRTGLRVSEVGCGSATLGLPNYIERGDPFSPDFEAEAIRALNHALDIGYNYIDSAEAYGNGRAEEIIGKVLRHRRSECYVATKVSWRNKTPQQIIESCENSLRRLQTDVIDVYQFHGGDYTEEHFKQIVEGGLLEAFFRLREQGKIRFIGITAEEPVTLRPFMATGHFDVIQIRYNIIYQNAWHNILPEAKAANIGTVIMRPLTSGLFQKLMRHVFPDIDRYVDLYELALNFVLSDPNVSTAIVGVRRVEELDRNNTISDNTAIRLDLEYFHDRFVRD